MKLIISTLLLATIASMGYAMHPGSPSMIPYQGQRAQEDAVYYTSVTGLRRGGDVTFIARQPLNQQMLQQVFTPQGQGCGALFDLRPLEAHLQKLHNRSTSLSCLRNHRGKVGLAAGAAVVIALDAAWENLKKSE